jgi:hypothetical protein
LSPAVTVGQGSNKKKRRSVLLCSLNSTHNNHIFPINSLLLLKLIHLKQINKNIIRWGCVLPLKVDLVTTPSHLVSMHIVKRFHIGDMKCSPVLLVVLVHQHIHVCLDTLLHLEWPLVQQQKLFNFRIILRRYVVAF